MPSLISLAADAPSVYTAARFYERMGFSVLPCTGKKPALKHWSQLQQRCASRETIDLWQKTGLLTNVGIITGAVSGNLVVIDLDGDLAVDAFYRKHAQLGETYTVKSGSGHGLHLYYYVEILPPTTRVVGTKHGNIELRANGCYVVAPPSLHPVSQKPYGVELATDILRLYDLRDVVEWIKSLMREKHGGHMPPPTPRPVQQRSAYGAVALDNAVGYILRAQPGERNNCLFRSALKMGSLIADGYLTRGDVERELLAAAEALTQTDGEAATLRTITSGIETGLQHPRSAWEKRD